MGLPFFITPVEPELLSKAAEKVAAGPRSSIRRQRTLRGPHPRPSAEARRRHMLGMVQDTDLELFEIAEMRQRTSSNPVDTSSASSQSRAMRIHEQERMRLRDALSFERDALSFEHQRPSYTGVDGPLMPPVPESRDYTTLEARQREAYRLRSVRRDLQRMSRRHAAPTPPYTDSDIVYMRGVNEDPELSITPEMLPSLRTANESNSPPRHSLEELTARRPLFNEGVPRSTYSEGRSLLSERVQELNRAANNMERSRRLIRQARLDGLGDRDRSLSPDRGAAWDTLLTSITPDPQPPSLGSSFASSSAAAAASSSVGTGAASASTSMTSVNRARVHDCDMSDSGSNTEDEEDIYDLPDSGGQNRGGRFWRTYADAATSRADRAAQNGASTRRTISNLDAQSDTPDVW